MLRLRRSVRQLQQDSICRQLLRVRMGSHQRRRRRAARLEALRKAAAEGSDDGSSDDDGLDGLVLEAGGHDEQGWNFKSMHQVIKNYESAFMEKDVRITLCLTSYRDWHGHGSRGVGVVYRSWIEFADCSKIPMNTPVRMEAYNPRIDYAHPPDGDYPAGGHAALTHSHSH